MADLRGAERWFDEMLRRLEAQRAPTHALKVGLMDLCGLPLTWPSSLLSALGLSLLMLLPSFQFLPRAPDLPSSRPIRLLARLFRSRPTCATWSARSRTSSNRSAEPVRAQFVPPR